MDSLDHDKVMDLKKTVLAILNLSLMAHKPLSLFVSMEKSDLWYSIGSNKRKSDRWLITLCIPLVPNQYKDAILPV